MSILSDIGHGLTGAIKGFATGGVGGAIGGALGGFVKGSTTKPPASAGGVQPFPYSNTYSASKLVASGASSAVGAGVVPSAKQIILHPITTAGQALVRTGQYIQGGVQVPGINPSVTYTVGRKRRRMNPMNVRAARRAIRRIRGARKILQRIERSLPKARTHHTARRVGR
jgi:hypothetical protein